MEQDRTHGEERSGRDPLLFIHTGARTSTTGAFTSARSPRCDRAVFGQTVITLQGNQDRQRGRGRHLGQRAAALALLLERSAAVAISCSATEPHPGVADDRSEQSMANG